MSASYNQEPSFRTRRNRCCGSIPDEDKMTYQWSNNFSKLPYQLCRYQKRFILNFKSSTIQSLVINMQISCHSSNITSVIVNILLMTCSSVWLFAQINNVFTTRSIRHMVEGDQEYRKKNVWNKNSISFSLRISILQSQRVILTNYTLFASSWVCPGPPLSQITGSLCILWLLLCQGISHWQWWMFLPLLEI